MGAKAERLAQQFEAKGQRRGIVSGILINHVDEHVRSIRATPGH